MSDGPMTTAQVNAAIAELRGWAMREDPDSGCIGLMATPGTPSAGERHGAGFRVSFCKDPAPNFCGSWALAGPLLEEMGGCEQLGGGERGWWMYCEHLCESFNGATPTEAISRAWLEMKRGG